MAGSVLRARAQAVMPSVSCSPTRRIRLCRGRPGSGQMLREIEAGHRQVGVVLQEASADGELPVLAGSVPLQLR
jgi:hypothetical protein